MERKKEKSTRRSGDLKGCGIFVAYVYTSLLLRQICIIDISTDFIDSSLPVKKGIDMPTN